MTKSTRKAIEKTLKHYDEMIEWAKGQKPRRYPDYIEMHEKIKQNWFNDFCPFCKKFYDHNLPTGHECDKCPLYIKYGHCGTRNSKSAWKKMNDAGTWKTWIRHATIMRQQIESLLEGVKP
jgi:hypothetical protein